MKCQFLDKRLNELMMMVLVRQTENYDRLLHMVMTDMKLLVVEIETADITADDVDKVSCSTDVERSKQYAKPEDPNELFQKLLEDLKELAEYDNSPSKDHPIFLNDDENHSLENSSNEIAVSNSNEEKEEPPQDLDIQLLCIHDNVDDLIESALNTKLLSINSQRLDNKEQEVKNVVEQPAERGNRSIESLQNFRVIHKSSISLNTSQISSIHAVAPILSTKEPEYSSSMGYEDSNTTPKTKSDEIKSGVEELVPILSENEVTSEDKRECDVSVYENSPVCDDHSEIFSDSKNDDDISVYDDDFEDIEFIEASLSDLFLASDNSILSGIENSADDSEGDIYFLEELLIDDSILSHESYDSNFEDNPSVPLPPLEPLDEEFDFGDEISVVIDKLEGIDAKVEFENNYYFFMFDKVFSFLSAESEDTIFDPDEAEYVAAARCCTQVLWIKSQLANYDVLYDNVHIFWTTFSKVILSFILYPLKVEPSFTRLVAELGMLNIEKEVHDKKNALSGPLT
nr:hypothetical protein [Tanacetum cinerariifolium]